MQHNHNIWLTLMVTLLVPLASLAQQSTEDALLAEMGETDSVRQYTMENPLIYEDAHDLWPYSFLSDDHEELGYNVDLVKIVMERLGIPYVIRLKERREVLTDMQEGKCDLTLGMDAFFHNPYGEFGNAVVQLFTHSVVWPKNQPQTIFSKEGVAENQVIVHRGSFSHHVIMRNGWGHNAIPCDDMKEAIIRLSENQDGQILWNTASLKWLIRIYHLDNLQIAPVKMEDGAYKFLSKDRHLLARLDSVMNELSVEKALLPIKNKWFYPEHQEKYIPSWVWNLTNAGVVLVILMGAFIIYMRYRLKIAVAKTKKRTKRLALIMQACKLSIWLYDVDKKRYMWVDKDGSTRSNYNAREFAQRVGANTYDNLAGKIRKIIENPKMTLATEITTYAEKEKENGLRTFVVTLSVLRYHHGMPKMLIGVCSDVTDKRKRSADTQERLALYHSVFSTAMVDMLMFDADGYITDMNERAQHTFQYKLAELVEKRVNIKNIIGTEDVNLRDMDGFHATLLLHRDDLLRQDREWQGEYDMFYELQLVPYYDRKGHQIGIYGTGRDVTEVVNTFRIIQSNNGLLQKANKSVSDYISNINNIMGMGGVRLVQYSPDTHVLTVFRSLDVIQHQLTQSRCMTLVDERMKKAAMRALNAMDSRTPKAVDVELVISLRVKGHPLYLHFQFVPTFDANGEVVNYFGMCRDQSEMKVTERLLEEETKRAKGIEDLKNSFLRNMSYEIRTPLNTVVGFSELFEQDHSPEDEEVFIREIKDNSAHLLDLINDILFLSRLDARMIEMNKTTVDFSKTFDAYCQMGWANYQKEGVQYIVENHFDQLEVCIDDTNIGRVIEQITANAAQYTSKGTVRARYDYINDKLMIAIEDTGCGMSKEVLAHVFERFASGNHNGTGLGLPICKELLEQMGGTIEITSKAGSGTAVWITMPCVATAIERKKEI